MISSTPPPWRSIFALIIAAIWAVSYLVSIASANYAGFEVSTPVMLIAAAYLLHSGA